MTCEVHEEEETLKVCGKCGCTYSGETWRKLAYVGRQDDDVEKLELRNCACGTTLAVQVEALERATNIDLGD